MQRMRSLLAVSVLASLALAGCLSDDNGPDESSNSDSRPSKQQLQADFCNDESTITPVEYRDACDFRLDGPYSYILRDAMYEIAPVREATITIDLPIGSGPPNADIHMGLFFPDIAGCDWDALIDQIDGSRIQSVEDIIMGEPCRLPVITDIGPYYGEPALGDHHATIPGARLGAFLVENFVPQGYIVAQVSVTGTGDSTGCMDLMGPIEQAGAQAAVEYLGTAGFSNGAVAPIGRSYDGSTPYEAVMDGNPYVKTIVPISGLYGQMDLMWKNGSVETRGPGVLWGLYYVFTYTGNDPLSDAAADRLNEADFEDPTTFIPNPDKFNLDPQRNLLQVEQIGMNAICPETQTGGAQAFAAYVTGGDASGNRNPYWETRSFDGHVLANYEGSVYFIHGMQDWNVDPHMAFPFYNKLENRGLDIKGLFGQWGHNYPDRVSEHPNNIRYDWAQDLLEWLDFYLKGTGPQPQLHVEMEDDHNQWRIEPTWPPADATTLEIGFDEMTVASGDATISPINNDLVLNLPIQPEDLRITGLPNLPITVTPQGLGGQVYAELRDATTGVKLGHATMDMRYYQGGSDIQVVLPGQSFVALMEFFPMDVFVPAGNQITLRLSSSGMDYLPSAISTPVDVSLDGSSRLLLPTVDRSAGQGFFTPPGWNEEVMDETAPVA